MGVGDIASKGSRKLARELGKRGGPGKTQHAPGDGRKPPGSDKKTSSGNSHFKICTAGVTSAGTQAGVAGTTSNFSFGNALKTALVTSTSMLAAAADATTLTEEKPRIRPGNENTSDGRRQTSRRGDGWGTPGDRVIGKKEYPNRFGFNALTYTPFVAPISGSASSLLGSLIKGQNDSLVMMVEGRRPTYNKQGGVRHVGRRNPYWVGPEWRALQAKWDEEAAAEQEKKVAEKGSEATGSGTVAEASAASNSQKATATVASDESWSFSGMIDNMRSSKYMAPRLIGGALLIGGILLLGRYGGGLGPTTLTPAGGVLSAEDLRRRQIV